MIYFQPPNCVFGMENTTGPVEISCGMSPGLSVAAGDWLTTLIGNERVV